MYSSVLYLTFISGFLVFLASAFNFKSIKSNAPAFLFYIVFLYSIFLALRPVEFGTDTEVYLRAYDGAAKISGFQINNNFELGYNLLMSFFKQIGADFSLFVFLTSFVFLSVVCVYVRKFRVNEVFVICFVLLSSTLLGLYTNAFRQGLAASLLVAAAYYLYVSRYFSFLVLCILASLFHVTSLAFVLILISAKAVCSRSIYFSLLFVILFFACTLLVYLNVNFVLSFFEFLGISGKAYSRLESYTSDGRTSGVGVGVVLSSLLILAALYFLRKTWAGEFFEINGVVYRVSLLKYIFLICLNSLAFYVVFSGYGVISRIYLYSIVFESMLLFFVTSCLFKKASYIGFLVLFVLFIGVASKFLLPVYFSFYGFSG